MLEILKTILYGIVQGISEWLPISSTGHMLLLNQFCPLFVFQDEVSNEAFFNLFLVVIQFGSILAVIVLFFNKLWPFKADKKESKEVFPPELPEFFWMTSLMLIFTVHSLLQSP